MLSPKSDSGHTGLLGLYTFNANVQNICNLIGPKEYNTGCIVVLVPALY